MNSVLRDLHYERVLRTTNATRSEVKTKTTNYTCAVCLEHKDETKGTLTPDNCSHKICVKCYTNIVLTNKNNIRCPQCRTPYVHKSEIIETEIDDYGEMPPLISLNELFINRNLIQVDSINNSINDNNQQIIGLWDIL